MVFFNYRTDLSPQHHFIIWRCKSFLVHTCKIYVRHFRKQTFCPRRNNAKLPGLAILVENLKVNQDDLADARLVSFQFSIDLSV